MKFYLRHPNPIDFFLLLVGLGFLVYGHYQEQFLPHHLRIYVAGTKVADYWTTNRYQITWQSTNVLTSHGYEIHNLQITNRLW